MVFSGERSGWAICDNDLFFYDGKKWDNRFEVSAGVSPELEKLVKRFAPEVDSAQMAGAISEIRTINNLGDSTVMPGQKILLPFKLAFRGRLTSIAVDPLQAVWIGTEMGLLRFVEGEFSVFGYAPFTVTKEKTLLEVAKRYTGDSNPQRLARWVERVKNYNRLTSDDVSPGQIKIGRASCRERV